MLYLDLIQECALLRFQNLTLELIGNIILSKLIITNMENRPNPIQENISRLTLEQTLSYYKEHFERSVNQATPEVKQEIIKMSYFFLMNPRAITDDVRVFMSSVCEQFSRIAEESQKQGLRVVTSPIVPVTIGFFDIAPAQKKLFKIF